MLTFHCILAVLQLWKEIYIGVTRSWTMGGNVHWDLLAGLFAKMISCIFDVPSDAPNWMMLMTFTYYERDVGLLSVCHHLIDHVRVALGTRLSFQGGIPKPWKRWPFG